MRRSLEMSGTPKKSKGGSCSWNKIKMWLSVYRINKMSLYKQYFERTKSGLCSFVVHWKVFQADHRAGWKRRCLASTVQAIWSQGYLSWSHNWRSKKYPHANGKINYKTTPKKGVARNFDIYKFVPVFTILVCKKQNLQSLAKENINN